MKKINLAITGCLGRMGQQIIKSSKLDKKFKLVTLTESKKIYKVDVELYKKFKKIKEENYQFDIPELFIEKYKVFTMIEEDGNLNWENFYANYKQKNLSSSYGAIFDNDDARTIEIN